MQKLGVETRPLRILGVGTRATSSWLRDLDLRPTGSWDVAIDLDDGAGAHFHIAIDPDEWGFRFERNGDLSWIRVRTAPMVHMRDDFGLLAITPGLRDLTTLVRAIEGRFQLRFRREHARTHTDLHDRDAMLRSWIASL
ncbi:MAG: hypothetical protein ABJE66_31795 [Deltaproteobacteria bacterium]